MVALLEVCIEVRSCAHIAFLPLVLPGPRLGLVVLALVLPPPVALLHRLVPTDLLRVTLLNRNL